MRYGRPVDVSRLADTLERRRKLEAILAPIAGATVVTLIFLAGFPEHWRWSPVVIGGAIVLARAAARAFR